METGVPFRPERLSRLARAALSPLAWSFRAAAAGRNLLFDTDLRPARRLEVPVVSVGNITVGGTGKTPLVAVLARRLASAGRRPAIVSRGYGGHNAKRPGSPVLVVSDGRRRDPTATAAVAGDEPVLLASMLAGIPVLVCRDRHKGGRAAREQCGAGLVILDDGFQHRALHRDADLVVLDAGDPFGGGRMLPAGPLREPPGSLRRAHLAILTRADCRDRFEAAASSVRLHAPDLPLFRARHRPVGLRPAADGGETRPLSTLSGAPVAAFAGLARPENLLATLENLGARVRRFDPFPDHHAYSAGEIRRLVEAGNRAGAELVITTAKDRARLGATDCPSELFVLDMEMEVENLDDLIRRVLDLCLPAAPGHLDAIEARE
jgi:tetraacyldisaccharide 4'-kinase